MHNIMHAEQENNPIAAHGNNQELGLREHTQEDSNDDIGLWLFDIDDDSFRTALLALDNINETLGDVTDNELDASSSTSTSMHSFVDENQGQNKRSRIPRTLEMEENNDFQSPFEQEEAILSPLSDGDSFPSKFQRTEASSIEPFCFPLVKSHSTTKRCEESGCLKFPQGGTRYCIAHGGGRRCTFANCTKGARDRYFCAAHGGGRRCSADGCAKAAVGGSERCATHGGGRKCQHDGCSKSAQSPTSFCVMHGGGRKCSKPGCSKVARGRTAFCAAHGGGQRCEVENCGRAAIAKHKTCRSHTKSVSVDDMSTIQV